MAQTDLESSSNFISSDINSINIAKIISIDTELQTVDVEIYNRDMLKNAGFEYLGEEIVLTGVPFQIIGGGKSCIEFPIASGDDCIILYNDFNYANWINSRSFGVDTTGEYNSRNYPVALIGLRSPSVASTDYSLTDMIIKNGLLSKIKIKPASVELECGNLSKVVVTEQMVEIEHGTRKIIVSAAGVNIVDGTGGNLLTALTGLVDAISNAVDTRGDVFNQPTKDAINAAKLEIEKVLG